MPAPLHWNFLQAGCYSRRPAKSVKALKAGVKTLRGRNHCYWSLHLSISFVWGHNCCHLCRCLSCRGWCSGNENESSWPPVMDVDDDDDVCETGSKVAGRWADGRNSWRLWTEADFTVCRAEQTSRQVRFSTQSYQDSESVFTVWT